jgi:hypothetical protein
LEDRGAIMLVTEVEEADPWRTHGRLELSWIGSAGVEIYRALYNTSQRANPVPPEAFGILNLGDGSVESAGIDGYMEVESGGFTFLTESAAARMDGVLSVTWVVRPPETLGGLVSLRARVLPKRGDSAPWVGIGSLVSKDGTWRAAEEVPQGFVADDELPAEFSTMLDEGNAETALRGLETQWAEGGDRATIEAIRAAALRRIHETGAFDVGKETFSLGDIRYLYEWHLKKPDVLVRRFPVAGDLPPDRLLFLALAVGTEHHEPAGEHGSYVLPAIDIASAIGSEDPWIVSAGLFLARKQELELSIDALVARWQGPLPWDHVCTEQAVLYLTTMAVAETVDLASLPRDVAVLDPPDPEGVEIQPWLFLSSGEWSSDLTVPEWGSGLTLEVLDSTMEPIGGRSVSSGDNTIEVPATRNFYSFRYLDGRMHGESRFVEGTKGVFVRMAVAVEGGV